MCVYSFIYIYIYIYMFVSVCIHIFTYICLCVSARPPPVVNTLARELMVATRVSLRSSNEISTLVPVKAKYKQTKATS